MNVWLVRSGKYGENETVNLDNGVARIGFDEVPNLASAPDRDAIKALLLETEPDIPNGRAGNWAAQLNAFANRIAVGDIIVMPLKTSAQVALGKVTSGYRFLPSEVSGTHEIGVDWVAPDVARSTFKQDLLYSFGAFMTVCQITRHNAAQRIKAVLDGKGDPGDSALEGAMEQASDEVSESDSGIDLQAALNDQIVRHIQSHFSGHGMARLVAAILTADGHATKTSPPGPDGGVDILAGKGPLGLDSPRLLVQVKTTSAPADVTVYRSLQGTIQRYQADQGLLVSWSGFTRDAQREADPNHFGIRLWDQADVLAAVFRTYDNLPGDIKSELPLTRTWALLRADPA